MPIDTGPCADVLGQEARWLKAITQEVASIVAEPFTMNPSEQIVSIAGDTAVIHGVNTLIGVNGKVLARERFTDVFVLQNGQWMALAAQETSF